MSCILRRVELWNFKSHQHSVISFAAGINAISGKNFAGKSSIVQAVGLCLYNSSTDSKTEYVRKGEKYALIHVEFVSRFDEKLYRVERRLGSGGYWKAWDVDRAIEVAQQDDDMQRFLRQHLRLRAETNLDDLFEEAVGVPQGSITAAFLLRPGERKKVFDSLLRVEEYGKAWEGLRSVTGEIQREIDRLNTQAAVIEAETQRLPALEASREVTAGRITEAEKQLTTLTQQLKEGTATEAEYALRKQKIESLTGQVQEAESNVRLAEQKRKTAEDALTEAETAQTKLVGLEPGYTAYRAAEQRKEHLTERHNQRGAIRVRLTTAETELGYLESKAETCRATAENCAAAETEAARLLPLAKKQAQLTEDLETAKSQTARLGGELDTARKAEAMATSGKCPLIGEACQNASRYDRPLAVIVADRTGESRQRLAEAEAERDRIQAELNALRIGKQWPDALYEHARTIAEGKASAEETVRQAVGAIEAQKGIIAGICAELAPFDNLDEEIAACKTLLHTHRDAHDQYLRTQEAAGKVEERRNTLAGCTTARDTAMDTLANRKEAHTLALAAYDASAHTRLCTELEDLKRKVTVIETDLKRDWLELEEADRTVSALRERAAEAECLRKRQREQQAAFTVAEDIREAVRSAGPKVAEMMVQQVSAEADRLFRGMIGENDVSLHWTTDYALHLTEHGADRSPKALAGSELSLAALAVRLALIESLGEVRFAFLDEPTIHLDEARRRALVEQLSGFTLFDQLIVISHDDSFEARIGNVIHIERIEGRSYVT